MKKQLKKEKLSAAEACNKLVTAIIAIKVGEAVLVTIANTFAECDNLDDATAILDQIAGQEAEEKCKK